MSIWPTLVRRHPEEPTMSKLCVRAFSLSLDGFGAGPRQDLDNPLGAGGMALHEWVQKTRTFQRMFEGGGGETGIDDDFAARGLENIGAWILGRNMFGPNRGDWGDGSWKGWWGHEPPYHTDVYVLTHHARRPLEMAGGTTFHFVTDGIHAALDRRRARTCASAAASGRSARTSRRASSTRCTSP
jgi:dihydrofolate reductase